MQLQQNISLKKYNTFGIDVTAAHFISVSKLDELKNVLSLKNYPNKLILGGGSNMLLTQHQDKLVVHVNLKGISIEKEDSNYVYVKANAGENWHEFVLWCLKHDFGGLENLSLIPGNVGTSPIQNIGAYGVELKDAFVSCDAINIDTLETITFTKDECNFGYRNSIFKNEVKGKYVITSVIFKLTKEHHELNMNYGAITTELEAQGIKTPTIQSISKAVIAIRQSKLPNPDDIGNSGSFFKNPVISKVKFEKLQKNFKNIPNYPISENEVKIPAGWLIETSGFKGKRFGNYGVHKNQALVLVNYGGAKGSDILELSKLIQKTVLKLFDISIEAEVNIL
ncbi:UDP-N-acetylmuramate dehydrogenase [Hyunsoonleella pacifica]|uniref:UDP-N-acetylenolpyruvoylglucosamine reductase n=1 Tax=Hyunsoonleella pacifica TaxID=1080224 RepID=A0A4Q9FJL8_9FLAO|nr:UDP-N-acetylmuramate dehydrogenase [Hyunsoonleella pacifica]TBN13857.1 UDP-N-acetylmuramate dehydrogenase [Hyunsoonleella pacifica]GGD26271.1 UDP-N-acetylenolpyruvoylglucosamine reductase [Hyunsoonleella pacifica]